MATVSPLTLPAGLTSAEAQERREAGQGNVTEERTARSFTSIIKANVLTRFNAIITSLAVVVLVFGDPVDALFGLVMVLNMVIGIVQEVRAKRSLDALQVLLVPSIAALRDGVLSQMEPEDLVLGDIIMVEAGDQIPVDGSLLDSTGLEVDESALTGESDPVPKPQGAEIFSGSVAVAGSALAEATRVGEDSWVHQLTREAKDFVLTESELRVGIDRLLRVVSWILPPLAALLVWSQLRSSATLGDGLIWAVAGVVALVPQGLVLLVSMALAIAVIRLGQKRVVVQELPAVEGLARIDVLCVDKTGTLTTGRLVVDELDPIGISEAEFRTGLASLAELDAARTATMDAIRPELETQDSRWRPEQIVPFSSVRKWSGATFGEHGSWVLGAPEILIDAMGDIEVSDVAERVVALTNEARRVLLLAHSPIPLTDNEQLPPKLEPVGLVSLKEEVRPDAAETMQFFRNQNVQIRVISGDNPRTVAAVAAEIGIPGAANHVDLRTVSALESIPEETTVFGRVLPEQKRDLVNLLKERGHTVAMTGDGVNDIPSLKAADIGIAMNTATPATKAIAQLVLLDGRFDRLPGVVAEGRRVIANMERVSSLFVTKTVYATVLALTVGVVGIAFPFLPRHLSLIAAVTIGVPSFALSFRSSNEPCRPGYLHRVLRFSIPAGLVASTATFASYWTVRSSLVDADLEQARTAATITLTVTGLWVLYRLIRPLDRFEATILGGMSTVFAVMLIPSPLSEFYALELPDSRTLAILLGVLSATIGILQMIATRLDHRG